MYVCMSLYIIVCEREGIRVYIYIYIYIAKDLCINKSTYECLLLKGYLCVCV